jgi:hypothetical protein
MGQMTVKRPMSKLPVSIVKKKRRHKIVLGIKTIRERRAGYLPGELSRTVAPELPQLLTW